MQRRVINVLSGRLTGCFFLLDHCCRLQICSCVLSFSLYFQNGCIGIRIVLVSFSFLWLYILSVVTGSIWITLLLLRNGISFFFYIYFPFLCSCLPVLSFSWCPLFISFITSIIGPFPVAFVGYGSSSVISCLTCSYLHLPFPISVLSIFSYAHFICISVSFPMGCNLDIFVQFPLIGFVTAILNLMYFLL